MKTILKIRKMAPFPTFVYQCKTGFESSFSYLLAVFHLLFIIRGDVGVCNERLGVWRRDEAALLHAAG